MNGAGGTIKERMPQFALQLAYLRADARLGNVQPLGGAGEVRFLDHSDEVLQLTELHNRPF